MSRLDVLIVFGSALLCHGAPIGRAQEQAPTAATGRGEPAVRYEAEYDPPKGKEGEKRRDYALFEAALNDLVSPDNPEFKREDGDKGALHEVVFNDSTLRADRLTELLLQLRSQSRDVRGADARSIPSDVQDDFKRRSKAPRASLVDFKPANRHIVVRNLRTLFAEEQDTNQDFAGIGHLRRKYPTVVDFVSAYPPAYSRDGKSSIVVFLGVDGVHGHQWIYMLSRKGKRWDVEWRHLEYYK